MVSMTTQPEHVELQSTTDAKVDLEHADAHIVTGLNNFNKSDDEAMKAMAKYDGPPLILDEATSRNILRKIDWHIMPILYDLMTICLIESDSATAFSAGV